MNGAADRLLLKARKRLGVFEFQCDLDLPLTGLTALFGPSGSGKTTLINLVAGLHRPDQGRIVIGPDVFFDGANHINVPVERRALGVVFQDARLFPHLSVRSNLMYGFRRAGTRAHSPRVAFDAVVQLLGIGALLDRRPHTLSGGERQRVAIGRALLAHLIDIAKQNGIVGFTADVLATNTLMLHVFHSSGLKVESRLEDCIYSLRMPFAELAQSAKR